MGEARVAEEIDRAHAAIAAFAGAPLVGFRAPGYLISFFFFNDTATTEIYTLSLHDALPISRPLLIRPRSRDDGPARAIRREPTDRKSTRLNSSHGYISYAVFCLKKKKK